MLLNNKALPLLFQHRSFLPEYKSLVTCGLQRIKTLSFMYVSLEHQQCFGFIISGNINYKCFRDACLIEKVLEFCTWTSGKQDLERGQRSLSIFAERIFLVIPLSQLYFPSTCHDASNLGLKCVTVLMQNAITSSVCIPCSPPEQKNIFSHK